jgi:cytochrome c biogenesis protein CcmG, thiol:disulfide interchange protein DsbE
VSARSARKPARHIPLHRIALWLTIGAVGIGILIAIAQANRSVPQIASDAPPISNISKGDLAPDFSAETTYGNFALASARRPVFLEVFATWCPHCQRETVVLNQLYEEYKNQVDFVAVTGSPYAADRTSPESEADVLSFARYFNVRYPVAFDGSLAVAKSYLQGGYPTIVLIGVNKRVSYIGSGEVSKAGLESQIRRVAGQQ